MNADSKAIKMKRITGVALVFLIFIGLSIPLLKFTIGQFYYQQGVSLTQQSNFSNAIEKLNKAVSWQPNDAAIEYELGMAHLKTALDMKGMLRGVMAAKAVEYFEKSQELNHLEPETAYGLARASELLGQKSREQTLAAYHRAVELWPNNSLYRRAFARELYRQGNEQELLAEMQSLGSIDPASYWQLRREPYWSESAQQAFARGVEEAIAKNIDPRGAHRALAAILEKQEKWEEAALQYQKAMGYEPHRNTAQNFYRLGGLLLHTEPDEAVKVLELGLAKSATREKDLERLYGIFKDVTAPEFQLGFYQEMQNRFPLTWRLDMLMARTLIDAKEYEAAKEILEKVALQEQGPEPWYWLARVAELAKDWDGMELAIQKASIRDPNNSDYHRMFSRALARQQKYVPAEQQADRAIATRGKPNAWLYNHRAWLRWNQKNYEGALEDWQQANKIDPKNASFYDYIGRAYKKLGQNDLAMVAYSEALQRDPGNEKYKKELQDNSF